MCRRGASLETHVPFGWLHSGAQAQPMRLPGIEKWEPYSTVTDFARLRGWSTSHPRNTAM